MNIPMPELVASQRALRRELLETLYRRRAGHPADPWMHKRALAETLGTDPGFALGLLEELGHIESHGYTWRLTAAGALALERQMTEDRRQRAVRDA